MRIHIQRDTSSISGLDTARVSSLSSFVKNIAYKTFGLWGWCIYLVLFIEPTFFASLCFGGVSNGDVFAMKNTERQLQGTYACPILLEARIVYFRLFNNNLKMRIVVRKSRTYRWPRDSYLPLYRKLLSTLSVTDGCPHGCIQIFGRLNGHIPRS